MHNKLPLWVRIVLGVVGVGLLFLGNYLLLRNQIATNCKGYFGGSHPANEVFPAYCYQDGGRVLGNTIVALLMTLSFWLMVSFAAQEIYVKVTQHKWPDLLRVAIFAFAAAFLAYLWVDTYLATTYSV